MRFAIRLAFVAAVLAAPTVAGAGSFSGVDGTTSTVLQEGQSSFSGLGIRFRFQPPTLVRNIEIMPNIEYWRNSSSISAFDISSTRKDATLGVDGRYRFLGSGFEPYVGAGFALHFISASVNAPSLGLNNQNNSLIKGGLTALAGVSVPLSASLHNFFELKYHHVTEHRQLKLNWGLAYNP